ncbi:hypothetical protein ACF1AB_39160 [Streptomyces sp. NPDC014846]|uniref:hypothetical protein n=1 Tax=Streptomyces sp. NPDC014846 TaxID=3364922 RepID=UPI0036FCFE9B
MSAQDSGPAFTQVRLAGTAAEVDRLVAALSGDAEVIFDSASDPDARGEVERVLHLVTHPAPRPVTADAPVSVTVQTVLEADSAVGGLLARGAAKEVEDAVTGALSNLPQVRQASSRVVAAWGMTAPRE